MESESFISQHKSLGLLQICNTRITCKKQYRLEHTYSYINHDQFQLRRNGQEIQINKSYVYSLDDVSRTCQGCQIWHPISVRLALKGTNLGLFKISFSIFWLAEPKCTETDLKKSQICPIWGDDVTQFGATLTSLDSTLQLLSKPGQSWHNTRTKRVWTMLLAIPWYQDFS